MKRNIILLVAVLSSFTAVNVMAAKVLTPESLSGGVIISVQEAAKLSGNAKFYDMRKVINYGKGHVPGAVSIPFKPKSKKVAKFDQSKDKLDMSKFPTDKKTTVVFYSDGPYGWKSYKASVIAIKNGYTKVRWMRDGFANWKKAGSPSE